jgi:hypothetical protein
MQIEAKPFCEKLLPQWVLRGPSEAEVPGADHGRIRQQRRSLASFTSTPAPNASEVEVSYPRGLE